LLRNPVRKRDQILFIGLKERHCAARWPTRRRVLLAGAGALIAQAPGAS
jgi:hypothetical protein